MKDNSNTTTHVLNTQTNWEELYFYQKSDVIYQMSFAFCDRFINLYKDRTRDQIIQAARSCKQNIVEGLADGVTSSEMQLKLLNVARASLKELKEDYKDYVKSRHLQFYDQNHPKYDGMLKYCRFHNKLEDYEPFFSKWNDEDMCNYAITLCHMIDKMMMSFLRKLEQEFVTEGGIKERMYKVRTGYRQQQEVLQKKLESTISIIQQQLQDSQKRTNYWKEQYNNLRERALKAYNLQQEEIKFLKSQLGQINNK